MKKLQFSVLFGALATVFMFLAGCENGGDDGPSVNVTGKWLLVASDMKITADLIQTDENVTGTMTFERGRVLPLTSGSVDGDKLNLTFVAGIINITWTATVTDPTMAGTMTVFDGVNTATLTFTGMRK